MADYGPAFDISDDLTSIAVRLPIQEVVPEGSGRIHLLVHRDKGGMLRRSRYELREPSGALVASAQKCFQSYHLRAADDRSDVGKLKSNFSASEYALHGAGLDGKKCSVRDDDLDEKRETGQLRQQLACVQWRSKVFIKGFVSSVYAPAVVKGWVREVGSGTTHAIRRVEAKWDPLLKAFKVDHTDRQHTAPVIPSCKNIQIHLPDRRESGVVMQFDKVAKDIYSLEYGWPLSCMQAFNIALTCFDDHYCL